MLSREHVEMAFLLSWVKIFFVRLLGCPFISIVAALSTSAAAAGTAAKVTVGFIQKLELYQS